MQELQEQELKQLEQKTCVLYLYTPFCGTCQLAGKMLEVVDEMLADIPFYKNNLNYSPSFAKQHEIESVPCFILYQNGRIVKKGYAFHSVSYLYETIKQNAVD
ncbi:MULTISPECIES: thioredoxin family protein [Bacillus]|uniref:thioredoxin family protein n=1 Tax=Bacillus TaxID=1386 RepID=UPI00042318C0|nr:MULTISPECIES: thioredoxin family protein [Bacillus]QHZ45681.1 thioredoxin family protein [Bacillus sp. NSP9.1]WFA04515.1 thioredoxin family protein [Bacillus sp. HSf4]